jgi:hypothetical protein
MKRLLRALVCTAVVAFPGAALAQEKPAYPSAGAQDKAVQGTVTAMSGEVLTLKVQDKEMKFNVDEKTQVIARGASTASRYARRQGRPGVTLAEVVKVGESVEVRYDEKAMRASSVRVLGAGPGATADTRPKPVAGVVSAVTATSLTLKGPDGEIALTVDDKTDIVAPGATTLMRQKKAAGEKTSITDFVAAGDTVMVRFAESGASKLATHVRVTKKAAAK